MKINDISNETYTLLKEGLKASTMRSEAAANNISNINTKGYKRRYVSFEENLKAAEGSLELKNEDKKHMALNAANGQAEVKVDDKTSMREDGNNVDIDNEMVNVAANNLMYNAMISQVNSRLGVERYVINEGRR